MHATVIPLLTYDKLYPVGDLPERRRRRRLQAVDPAVETACYSFHCESRTLDARPHNARPMHGWWGISIRVMHTKVQHLLSAVGTGASPHRRGMKVGKLLRRLVQRPGAMNIAQHLRDINDIAHMKMFKSRASRRRRLSLLVILTYEDPLNAHQAQHRPVQATGAMSL